VRLGSIEAWYSLKSYAESSVTLAAALVALCLCNPVICIVPNELNLASVWAERSLPWLRENSRDGCKYAQYLLAYFHCVGVGGVPIDFCEAVNWFKQAAQQGHAAAQCSFGDCLCSGNGVAKNGVEGLRWYRFAVEQGDADAQRKLGYCFQTGVSVKKNSYEAVRFYRLAAEQGDALAQYYLGCCCENGVGICRNKKEAARWYQLGALRGCALAQCRLGHYFQKGIGVNKDYSEAVFWYRRAADQGNAEACVALRPCFDKAVGKARREALWYWYQLATSNDGRDYGYTFKYAVVGDLGNQRFVSLILNTQCRWDILGTRRRKELSYYAIRESAVSTGPYYDATYEFLRHMEGYRPPQDKTSDLGSGKRAQCAPFHSVIGNTHPMLRRVVIITLAL
jgi:TPR repeat protein